MSTGTDGYAGLLSFFVQRLFTSNTSGICVSIRDMRFPQLLTRKKNSEQLNRKDAQVFARAKELASLRLEQCITDLQIFIPAVKDKTRSPLRKINLP